MSPQCLNGSLRGSSQLLPAWLSEVMGQPASTQRDLNARELLAEAKKVTSETRLACMPSFTSSRHVPYFRGLG